jgi:hypothetical protein
VPGVSGDAGLERAEAPPSSGLRANIAVTESSLERFSQVRETIPTVMVGSTSWDRCTICSRRSLKYRGPCEGTLVAAEARKRRDDFVYRVVL